MRTLLGILALLSLTGLSLRAEDPVRIFKGAVEKLDRDKMLLVCSGTAVPDLGWDLLKTLEANKAKVKNVDPKPPPKQTTTFKITPTTRFTDEFNREIMAGVFSNRLQPRRGVQVNWTTQGKEKVASQVRLGK